MRLSGFSDSRHIYLLRLSALNTCRLYTQEGSLVLVSFRRRVDTRVVVRPERLSQ
jgi:hypothetical protein